MRPRFSEPPYGGNGRTVVLLERRQMVNGLVLLGNGGNPLSAKRRQNVIKVYDKRMAEPKPGTRCGSALGKVNGG